MQKKRVLLLNPPNKHIVFRDYYCTKVSKSGFYYHPLDLIYLTGRLSSDFEVFFLDCIAERLDENSSINKIKEIRPEVIIFLIASPVYSDDVRFLNALKSLLPQAMFIGGGDVYRELKKKAFDVHGFLDAVFLDFSTDHILQFLRGVDGQPIDNIIYRFNGNVVEGKESHPSSQECDMPIPRWDLVKIHAYSFPFAVRKPFATVLTDFGCAYNCTFCPMGTIGFKLRPLNVVLSELELLKQMGVKEILFRDQTFGANKRQTIELCREMIEKRLGFSWTAYSRVDVLDESSISWMKKAGCHMLMFGLETSSRDIADKYRKNLKIELVSKTIGLCHKYGISTGGWFILGFPEEDERDIENTIHYAIDSRVDFAVFNILSPRLGTSFREACLKEGIIDKEFIEMDSSFKIPEWNSSQVSKERLSQLKRKAYIKFYLRPGYIFKRLRNLRSFYGMYNYISNGLGMMFRQMRNIS